MGQWMMAIVSALAMAASSAASAGELKIGILLPRAQHNVTHMSLEQVLPVVDIAIQNAKSSGLIQMRVSITANDSKCDYAEAPIIAILLMQKIDLLLGPYCSFCLAAVARYNRYELYRKPIITTGGIASPLVDKAEYFNLIRVGPSYEGVEKMLLQIFERYNWKPRPVQTVLFIELPDDDSKEKRTRDEIGVSQSRILSQGFERLFVRKSFIVRRLQYEKDNALFKTEIFRVMREEVRSENWGFRGQLKLRTRIRAQLSFDMKISIH